MCVRLLTIAWAEIMFLFQFIQQSSNLIGQAAFQPVLLFSTTALRHFTLCITPRVRVHINVRIHTALLLLPVI